MNRTELLNGACQVINGDRDASYGSAQENFTRIARLWEQVLGINLTPETVALCMSLVKIARLVHSPDHEDSWMDLAGYAALGGELSGLS